MSDKPFTYTERVGPFTEATVEANTAEALARLAGLPRPFVVPPGHVLKVVVEAPDATQDQATALAAAANRWLNDPKPGAVCIGAKVHILAVPAPCPECNTLPPRHHYTCKTGLRDVVTLEPTKETEAAFRAEFEAAGERMAAQRRSVGMEDPAAPTAVVGER